MTKALTHDEREQKYNRRRIEFQEEAVRRGVWMSCINCDNFNIDERMCNKYHAPPPLRVIVHGCSSWQIEMPF